MSKNLTNELLTVMSDHLQTSKEIIEAIDNLSDDVMITWMSPSNRELLSIWETVTKNGLIDAKEFVWGSFGNKWAESIGDIKTMVNDAETYSV